MNTASRVVAIFLSVTACPTALSGQEAVPSATGADRLLADFEAAFSSQPPSAKGSQPLSYLIFRADHFSAEKIDSVLAGLERLALESQSQRVRQEAAMQLAVAGEPFDGARTPIAGTVERAERVFDASTDPMVRVTLVARMALQEERHEAVQFLVKAAQQATPDEIDAAEPPALWALHALVQLDGEDARSALRDLHSSGRVVASAARARLAYLASRGFRP